jgi:hypothetical protein
MRLQGVSEIDPFVGKGIMSAIISEATPNPIYMYDILFYSYKKKVEAHWRNVNCPPLSSLYFHCPLFRLILLFLLFEPAIFFKTPVLQFLRQSNNHRKPQRHCSPSLWRWIMIHILRLKLLISVPWIIGGSTVLGAQRSHIHC